MSTSLTTALGAFSAGDLSARVLGGVFTVLPFAAAWRPSLDLRARAAELDPALADRIAQRAEELAASPGAQSALSTFDLLDKSDAGIAVFSGLRGAVKVAQGQGGSALEMDPQQAADAGLKAIGIAWVAWKLFDGPLAPTPGVVPSPADRIRALTGTPTGRALLTWYAAADLVLPFADNVATGGTAVLTKLIDGQAAEHAARLASMAGADATQATGMLRQLMDTLQTTIGQAATYAEPLTRYAQTQLPSLLGNVDKATGVVATGLDALSTYRLLGACLVAEVCVTRAAEQVQAEARAEAEAIALAKAEADRKAAELAAVEEAARQARALAEHQARQARERASAQQEDYTLDTAVPAASLAAAPIKVTRSSDVATTSAGPPAKSGGCMGCGALFLLAVLGAGAAVAAHWVA